VHAPRDPAWSADGHVSDRWVAVSPVSGRLDSCEWKVAEERRGNEDGRLLLEELVSAGDRGMAAQIAEQIAAIAAQRQTEPAPGTILPGPVAASASTAMVARESISRDPDPRNATDATVLSFSAIPPNSGNVSEAEVVLNRRTGTETKSMPRKGGKAASDGAGGGTEHATASGDGKAASQPAEPVQFVASSHAPDDPGPAISAPADAEPARYS
jgi:HemY protein